MERRYIKTIPSLVLTTRVWLHTSTKVRESLLDVESRLISDRLGGTQQRTWKHIFCRWICSGYASAITLAGISLTLLQPTLETPAQIREASVLLSVDTNLLTALAVQPWGFL